MLTLSHVLLKRSRVMKHDILIIDDQLDIIQDQSTKSRREEYMYFFKKIKESDPTFELVLDFAENPFDFQTKVRKNYYSAIIIDAVLNEFGEWAKQGFTITNALDDLIEYANETPIAIVSSKWEETNGGAMAKAWRNPNCRTFLHWRDIREHGDGQFSYAEVAVISMLTNKVNLDTTTKLDANESIRILHISDIQLGGFDSTGSNADISECADKILIHWFDKPPTFIVLTGDVAEHGDPKQYTAAREWINYLCNRLTRENKAFPKRNILYVPGNHDVNLRLAGAARIKLDKDKNNKLEMTLEHTLQQDVLLAYAYMPFKHFLSEISDCPLLTQDVEDQNFAWIESRFRHLGVVFYGINTAQPASAFDIPAREVNADALTRIGNELEKIIGACGEPRPIVIGLGHHTPVSASGDAAVTNTQAFAKLFNRPTKTALFLHGHTHEGDTLYTFNQTTRLSLVRSCAGTFTKESSSRTEDYPRGFSLIELKRENNSVTQLEIASFGWVGNIIQRVDNYENSKYTRHQDGQFYPTLPTN